MNWNAFKRLFHYLGRYKLRLILVMIAAVLSTLFTVLTPAVTGGITSELYDGVASGSFDWAPWAASSPWSASLFCPSPPAIPLCVLCACPWRRRSTWTSPPTASVCVWPSLCLFWLPASSCSPSSTRTASIF